MLRFYDFIIVELNIKCTFDITKLLNTTIIFFYESYKFMYNTGNISTT